MSHIVSQINNKWIKEKKYKSFKILILLFANMTTYFNLLTPNVNYSGHTASLTPKFAFYVFIQQI